MNDAANTPDIPWEVLAALARLDPKQFASSRNAFAALLGVTPKALQMLVAQSKAALKEERPYTVHSPWESPVDLSDVLSEVAQLLLRYLVVDTEQADAMALWITNTHVFDTAVHAPLLIVNAPERACGKTLALEIVNSLSHRAMASGSISMSGLFRTVDLHKPTLLIDEADTFIGKNTDTQGFLNSGYKRGTPMVRVEKTAAGAFEPKTFDVFCPKAIAGIALEKHITDATMSRGIQINMRRKLAEETVERWRYVDPAIVERLARSLVRAGVDVRDAIEQARPSMPEELSDRDQDNWQPLFAIAEIAGPDWVKRAWKAAVALSGKASQPESLGHELLRDIQDVLKKYERSLQAWPDQSKSKKYITTSDLLSALLALPDSNWNEYYRGEPLSPKQLAKQIAPYGLRPKTVRIRDGVTPKGYEIRIFKDAFVRYLKDEEVIDEDTGGPPPETPTEPPQRAQEPPRPDAAY